MKKRFKKFSNGSSNNLGEKSFDEVDRIFNLSGDYTKGNITQSQSEIGRASCRERVSSAV